MLSPSVTGRGAFIQIEGAHDVSCSAAGLLAAIGRSRGARWLDEEPALKGGAAAVESLPRLDLAKFLACCARATAA